MRSVRSWSGIAVKCSLIVAQVGKDSQYGDSLRVKAMAFVMSVVRLKHKLVIKLKLVAPLLHWLFPIMCTLGGDEDEEDLLFDDNEANTPAAVASQVLDCMAMHIAPEKIMSPLENIIQQHLASAEESQRAAGYMAMAVVCEGCADHIMTR